MRCEVQVHDKTYKRGTWDYHLADGWYLETSPEHYRTHICNIKTKNIEHITNMAQFRHKRITKPNITHAGKIMAAIADCDKAIKNMGESNGADEMHQLIKLTERAVQHNPAITAASKLSLSTTENPRGRSTQPALRVLPSGNQTQKTGFQDRWLADDSNDRCQTRSMKR